MLQFVAIIPIRAKNLTTLRWDMVDFEKSTITIPRSEMKDNDPNLPDFTIPLPRQAITILKETFNLTGWGRWVFCGIKDIHGPINNETGNKALRQMGFVDEKNGRKQTLHSFRGTYRSLVDTHQREHNAAYEVKTIVLDHHEQNKTERAYSHMADYTDQMRNLLQWWSDFLDKSREKK
jgi:integrase